MQVSSNAEVKPNNWGGVVELWSGGLVGARSGGLPDYGFVRFLPVRHAVHPRELRKLHQLGRLGSERPQSDRAIPAF